MAVLEALLLAAGLALAVRLLLAYRKFRRLELAIVGPASLPLLGSLQHAVGITQENFLATFFALWGWRHAELWRFSVFGHLMVVVSDPDHMQEIYRRKDLSDKDPLIYEVLMAPIHKGLLSLNGATWRAHRRLLQPAFHPGVLNGYTSLFSAEARGFVHRVRPGEAQDVADNLMSLLTRSFAFTALASSKGEAELERVLPDIKALVTVFAGSFSGRVVKPWLWPGPLFGLTASGRKIRRLKARVEAFLRDLIASERARLQREGPQRSDGDRTTRTLLDVMLEPGEQDPSLTDDEVVNEILIFAGAAIESSSTTLGWVFKTLSLRQDVQERLLQEAEEVLGKEGTSHITPDDLDKLEYTERVLKETLRLLPALPFLAREVKTETEFCGRTLPAGTTLAINVLGAHRDPRHWPDPLRFDPDRFLPENSEGRHPFAYTPFSAGARNCIGGRYAMIVMKTLLATLVPRYRIDPIADGYKEPADLPITFGLASKMVGGVQVVFTPRQGADRAA